VADPFFASEPCCLVVEPFLVSEPCFVAEPFLVSDPFATAELSDAALIAASSSFDLARFLKSP